MDQEGKPADSPKCCFVSEDGQKAIRELEASGHATDDVKRTLVDQHACKADATWSIYTAGDDPYRVTEGCDDHVGHLLGEGVNTLYPIAPPPAVAVATSVGLA